MVMIFVSNLFVVIDLMSIANSDGLCSDAFYFGIMEEGLSDALD